MNSALIRKARQIWGDPALRRYLMERLAGRIAAPPRFVAGHPPYLRALDLGDAPHWSGPAGLAAPAPTHPIRLTLPGAELTLGPDRPQAIWEQAFPDIETHLAIHRFAWLPLAGPTVDHGWVDLLWRSWCERFGRPGPGWEWHPYTAAERLINILDFTDRTGMLPGEPQMVAGVLAGHGPAIAARLEYGGEHYTGNHLSNNGRGLYRLGCALGWEACAELGRNILLTEARRIFSPSGLLREESSHYHLLLTRNYLSAWLTARAHGRPEAAELADICRRAVAAARLLALPGGLPLVGDVSPDCPPAFLAGLVTPGDGGWMALLPPSARDAVVSLIASADGPPRCGADGWMRADHHQCSLLVHAAPDGWPAIPGHGHQDLGSFELHWRGIPLIIDPGRGAYGEAGEAAWYRSASVHNGLQLDGADPTPPNRPYYDAAFRGRVGGPGARLERTADGIRLDHHGFRRQGAAACLRRWRLDEGRVVIEDSVEGTGDRLIRRSLTTGWPAAVQGEMVVVDSPAGTVRIGCAGAAPRLLQTTRWIAYGDGRPATRIEFDTRHRLPWRGDLCIELG
jgi:hypothetical protein